MTTTTTPQLALTRIFNAPRELLYREFTDPDRLARWWARLAMHSPATRWTSTCARRPPAMDGGLSGRSRTSRERRTRPCGGRRRRAARRRDYSLGVSLWRLGKRARSRTVQLTAEAAKTGRRAGLPDNFWPRPGAFSRRSDRIPDSAASTRSCSLSRRTRISRWCVCGRRRPTRVAGSRHRCVNLRPLKGRKSQSSRCLRCRSTDSPHPARRRPPARFARQGSGKRRTR